jgi:hypothetical protein
MWWCLIHHKTQTCVGSCLPHSSPLKQPKWHSGSQLLNCKGPPQQHNCRDSRRRQQQEVTAWRGRQVHTTNSSSSHQTQPQPQRLQPQQRHSRRRPHLWA